MSITEAAAVSVPLRGRGWKRGDFFTVQASDLGPAGSTRNNHEEQRLGIPSRNLTHACG